MSDVKNTSASGGACGDTDRAQCKERAGFVAVVGRPNAGKSTFINAILGEKLALVSHKANATRKRMNLIAMQKCRDGSDAQVVFIDTPGLHRQEKLLNQYMLKEALKALSECDVALFLAPFSDKTDFYAEFLRELQTQSPGVKKHILLLTKTDEATRDELLAALKKYEPFCEQFSAIIPVSIKDPSSLKRALNELAELMPPHPFYYDPEILSPNTTKEIAKELIRESLFENLSDELPYESDVQMVRYSERSGLHHIKANIIVHKESQKGMVIGKGGATLKRIGKAARGKIERFVGCKVYLELVVKVISGWSKEAESLKKMGYDFEE